MILSDHSEDERGAPVAPATQSDEKPASMSPDKKNLKKESSDESRKDSDNLSSNDAEQQNPHLQRRLKSRHLQMIAIGMSISNPLTAADAADVVIL